MSNTLDTPSQFTFERSLYIGGQITGILYGVQLVVFSLSCTLLLKTPNPGKDTLFYISYGAGLVALWTIALACNALFGQFAWIDHRDVPGGPAAFIEEHISDAFNALGTTAGVVMNLMGDALLIYRCYVIWSSWKFIVLPVLLYLGAMSMSILLIYESARPGANFFVGRAVDFGVPYVSLTISLNIIVTTLICWRLLSLRSQVSKVLGIAHAKMYTSITAIMVESAALFTVSGIVYVIVYARKSQTSMALVQIWGDFCAISPQIIILRIAMGQGWTKDTAGQLTSTTMSFDINTDPGKDTNNSVTGPELSYYPSRNGGASTIV